MHIGKDAADRDEGDERCHDDVEEDADIDVCDVFFEIKSDNKEDGGDDHSVGRREGRFAGAVWAGIQHKNLIKEEVG